MALAAACEQIVELGVNEGTSTLAFLLGNEKCKLDSWDIVKTAAAAQIEAAAGGRWTLHVADSRDTGTPECDMLFIDSLHTADQLASELRAHARKVKGRIVLHDTVVYGHVGENGAAGLRAALIDFLLEASGRWQIEAHYPHNNGLTVLRRIS